MSRSNDENCRNARANEISRRGLIELTTAAGATMAEAMEIAMTAASVVIHQLGTTGTAGVPQIAELLPA